MPKLGTKTIFKLAALATIILEAYWVFWLNREPHTMSLSGSIVTLFGANSAHEHVQTYLSQGEDK